MILVWMNNHLQRNFVPIKTKHRRLLQTLMRVPAMKWGILIGYC
jgi:hypothetical protein